MDSFFAPHIAALEPSRRGKTEKMLTRLPADLVALARKEEPGRVELFVSLLTTASEKSAISYLKREWKYSGLERGFPELLAMSHQEFDRLIYRHLSEPKGFGQIYEELLLERGIHPVSYGPLETKLRNSIARLKRDGRIRRNGEQERGKLYYRTEVAHAV